MNMDKRILKDQIATLSARQMADKVRMEQLQSDLRRAEGEKGRAKAEAERLLHFCEITELDHAWDLTDIVTNIEAPHESGFPIGMLLTRSRRTDRSRTAKFVCKSCGGKLEVQIEG
jgi:hypothetical protein